MKSNRAESAPARRGREGFEKPMPVSPSRSPRTAIKPTNAVTTPKRISTAKGSKRILRRDPLAGRCSIAMARTESLMVSSSGDVIVCRCRRSSTPYISVGSQDGLENWSNVVMPCCDANFINGIEGPWSPVLANLTSPRDLPNSRSDISTYEWEKTDAANAITSKGLKGGAMHSLESKDDSAETTQVDSQPKSPLSPEDPAPIMPLPSFDYSHIDDGHNDMVIMDGSTRRRSLPVFPTILEYPEEKKDEASNKEDQSTSQKFYHGVPVVLSTLSQVRISKVSANPLGAHVLLISAEALLFTYGLNNHGQLGIGIRSSIKDGNRGFVTSPTLITPLLENGGKAINCAAGVNHSLVVVATEGRRVGRNYSNPNVAHSEAGLALSRATSSPYRISTDSPDEQKEPVSGSSSKEAVHHHQLYGFGSNRYMKIGLVNKTLSEDGGGDVEDVLLPHRVALHCAVWPEEGSSSSFPPQGIFDIAASAEHSAALLRRATGDVEVYTWGHASLGALGLELPPDEGRNKEDNPQPTPTEKSNIFPLPTLLESLSYRSDTDAPFPVQISLGPYCSFVVLSNGSCYSFGFSVEGMLGQAYGVTHSMNPKEVFHPSGEDGKGNGIVYISAGAFHAFAVTENGESYSWGINSDDRLGLDTQEFMKTSKTSKEPVIEWVPRKVVIKDSPRVLKACAGYDSSLVVLRSGQVLTVGKHTGRLGMGEKSATVPTPEPMYGGIRLFYNRKELPPPL